MRDGRWVVVAALLTLAIVGLWKLAQRDSLASHKRGALLSNRIRRRARFKLRDPGSMQIAGVSIAALDETKHFKFIGTTGTGKSTAIRQLLRNAIDRGDIILNPFDPASVQWDLFGEIQTHYDAQQLASALIPDCEDASAQEWRAYSRTFLAAVIRRCHERRTCKGQELWRLLTAASTDELRPWVAGTPAQPFLDPDNARMFGSIRAVLVSAMAGYEFVQAQRARPFSVRRWIRESGHGGNLFISYKAGQIPALKSMIAAWLRLAIFEAMNEVDNKDQRLWFVVDELDALGAIDGLKDALARLRKFGGRCVLGFQSIAQVSTTYGQGAAQTIVENCGNTLILRCAGSENGGTSHFASRLIGEREVVRRQTSRGRDREGSFNAKGGRRSRNVTEQRVTEAAVMPAELEQLPDLVGYLKTASSPAWLKVALLPR